MLPNERKCNIFRGQTLLKGEKKKGLEWLEGPHQDPLADVKLPAAKEEQGLLDVPPKVLS